MAAAHYDLWIVEKLIETEKAHSAMLEMLTGAYVELQARVDRDVTGKPLPVEVQKRRMALLLTLNDFRNGVYALKLDSQLVALVKEAAALIDDREDD